MQKAFEENIPAKKRDYEMTDNTRESPDVRTRQTNADASIKDREAVNEREERKDYPEVTPTAMSNFICDKCGKEFQNQQDLVHHREFESWHIWNIKIKKHSRLAISMVFTNP